MNVLKKENADYYSNNSFSQYWKPAEHPAPPLNAYGVEAGGGLVQGNQCYQYRRSGKANLFYVSGRHEKRGIAYHLNDHGVPCPSAYKRKQGLKYETPNGAKNPLWSTITIAAILKNPVYVYVGDLAQGRNRVKSYKIHKVEAVPEEEWIVVQNTHEAIIERELIRQGTVAKFAAVQKEGMRDVERNIEYKNKLFLM